MSQSDNGDDFHDDRDDDDYSDRQNGDNSSDYDDRGHFDDDFYDRYDQFDQFDQYDYDDDDAEDNYTDAVTGGTISTSDSMTIFNLENLRNKQVASMYLQEEFADVHIEIEGERLPCHRCILASSCDYFKVLFFGGMQEQFQTVVSLHDVSLKAFKAILGFIYTGKLQVDEEEDEIMDILSLAHKYNLQQLLRLLKLRVATTMTPEDVCSTLDQAFLLSLDEVIAACRECIVESPNDVLEDENFNTLSSRAVEEIIATCKEHVKGVEVFNSVRRWIQENGTSPDRDKLRALVDLSEIEHADLLRVVRPSGLFSSDEVLDAMEKCLENEEANDAAEPVPPVEPDQPNLGVT